MATAVVCALAAAMATTAAEAADAAASAPDAAWVDQGRKTYTSFCVRCHGINLVTAGIGFDLRTFPRDDKERFVRSVAKGLRAMPAWEATLQAADIDAIWAYVGSVNGWNDAPPQK
jgi:mono/diheme cytochrome c family protein